MFCTCNNSAVLIIICPYHLYIWAPICPGHIFSQSMEHILTFMIGDCGKENPGQIGALWAPTNISFCTTASCSLDDLVYIDVSTHDNNIPWNGSKEKFYNEHEVVAKRDILSGSVGILQHFAYTLTGNQERKQQHSWPFLWNFLWRNPFRNI